MVVFSFFLTNSSLSLIWHTHTHAHRTYVYSKCWWCSLEWLKYRSKSKKKYNEVDYRVIGSAAHNIMSARSTYTILLVAYSEYTVGQSNHICWIRLTISHFVYIRHSMVYLHAYGDSGLRTNQTQKKEQWPISVDFYRRITSIKRTVPTDWLKPIAGDRPLYAQNTDAIVSHSKNQCRLCIHWVYSVINLSAGTPFRQAPSCILCYSTIVWCCLRLQPCADCECTLTLIDIDWLNNRIFELVVSNFNRSYRADKLTLTIWRGPLFAFFPFCE